MTRRTCTALVLLAAVAAGPSAAASPPSASQLGLDAETRARLDRSETVRLPIDEERGALRMIGGTSMKVVDFPASAVWSALERARDLGEALPGDSTVRETYRRGDERGAVVRHVAGPIEATYHVQLSFDADRMLLFFRLDPSYRSRLRAGWGFVQVSGWSEGRALVRFGALVDVGTGLVTSLMRPTLHSAILDVPRTFERYLVRCQREPGRCYGT